MSIAFSSDGVEAISRKLDSALGRVGSGLCIYYELERCKNFILKNHYQKVALQFPDHLLCDSTQVASRLAKETGSELFVLGDTSYGSCCVDEVAAEHNAADCIIHFGPSCLTRTKRLPVLLVFGREEVDVEDCSHCFREAFPSKDQHILLLYDTTYSHCIGELSESVGDYKNCIISRLVLPESYQQTTPPLSVPNSVALPVTSAGPVPPSPTVPGSIASNTSSANISRTLTLTTATSTVSSPTTAPVPSPARSAPLSDVSCSSIPSSASPSSAVTASWSSSSSSTETTPTTQTAEHTSSSHISPCEISGTISSATRSNDNLQANAGITCSCGRSESTTAESSRSSFLKCRLHGSSERCGEGSVRADNIQVSKMVPSRFGRHFQLEFPIETYRVFYIGTEGPTLTNLLLNYSQCQFSSYNPVTKQWRKESVSVNKALGKRYYLVQKAKEAGTVGIIVGTLGAEDYLEVIERMKKVLKQAGKKYYTIAVGKLNVPKIANFLEIDIFVLVACPENSLIDSQDFFRPVLTPYELELACLRSKEWTGEYSTDYQDLLPGACFHTILEEGGAGKEVEPEYSLITGAFVPTRESSEVHEGHSMALQTRSKMEVAERNSAMAYLQKRSWQGLEQRLGETEVGVAVEGRSGIASAYEHEQH